MNPIPNEEDFDEVETKIEELAEKYKSDITFEQALKEFASWAIDQCMPEEDDVTSKLNIYQECYTDGFNACRQVMETNKKDLGL